MRATVFGPRRIRSGYALRSGIHQHGVVLAGADFLFICDDSPGVRRTVPLESAGRGGAGAARGDPGRGGSHRATALEADVRFVLDAGARSEEHTSELQSHSFISYA